MTQEEAQEIVLADETRERFQLALKTACGKEFFAVVVFGKMFDSYSASPNTVHGMVGAGEIPNTMPDAMRAMADHMERWQAAKAETPLLN